MSDSIIPKKMKAVVSEELGQPVVVTEVDVPVPGPGEVLVKVAATGVCHTDLHAVMGDWPVKPKDRLIPGHEGVGTVVALGPGVTDVEVGDIIGNAWLGTACGGCEFCRTSRENLCEAQGNSGYSRDGSYAEYMVVDPKFAGRIPAGVDLDEIAPILCAGVTVYKALKETEVKPGQWVVISGIGGLGHVAVQYAHAMGMRVVAVDIDQSKLDLAKKYGAEVLVNAREGDPIAEVQEAIGGAHGVLVTAVHPIAFSQGLGMTRRGGTIVLVGLPPGTFEVDIFDVVLRGLTIRGSIVGTRQDLQEAIDFYTAGKIHPTVSVEDLDNAADVLHRLEEGDVDGRIVLKVEED